MTEADIRLEIYKVYAASVYTFEDRAQVTSRLLVTLNVALTSALAYGFSNSSLELPSVAVQGLIFCAMCFCFIWWLTLRSITRHTSAKHEILQKLEKDLPCQPYTDEWHEQLNSGKGYLKTTTIHELFPWIFVLAYLLLAISRFVCV